MIDGGTPFFIACEKGHLEVRAWGCRLPTACLATAQRLHANTNARAHARGAHRWSKRGGRRRLPTHRTAYRCIGRFVRAALAPPVPTAADCEAPGCHPWHAPGRHDRERGGAAAHGVQQRAHGGGQVSDLRPARRRGHAPSQRHDAFLQRVLQRPPVPRQVPVPPAQGQRDHLHQRRVQPLLRRLRERAHGRAYLLQHACCCRPRLCPRGRVRWPGSLTPVRCGPTCVAPARSSSSWPHWTR